MRGRDTDMKIYDNVIRSVYELLGQNTDRKKQLYSRTGPEDEKRSATESVCAGNEGQNEIWQDAGEYNMILPSEMAFELGGGVHKAVSALGFTSDRGLVGEDEILLFGPDLPEIRENIDYARITLIRLREDFLGEKDSEDRAYQTLRNIDYVRYRLNPCGYMMRISSAEEREPVRIGREALARGMDFKKVGRLFLQEYHRNPEVLGVKLIFITLKTFPYNELSRLSGKLGKITESLNHIFSNLEMNCSACGLREVCDEAEELKELHFRRNDRNGELTE